MKFININRANQINSEKSSSERKISFPGLRSQNSSQISHLFF